MTNDAPWLIQVVRDSPDGLLAEVKSGTVEIAVFSLDSWPYGETEPIMVMVDSSVPRFNVFWRNSTVLENSDPTSHEFGFMMAQCMAITIMKVQDKFGVE